jgi:hypothetical protein
VPADERSEPGLVYVCFLGSFVVFSKLPLQGPDFDPFPENPDAEVQNVSMYLAACEQLGIAGFEVQDLCGDGDVRLVLDNLIQFAGAAAGAGLAALDLPAEEEAAPEPEPAPAPVPVAAAPVAPKKAPVVPAVVVPPPATSLENAKLPPRIALSPRATSPRPGGGGGVSPRATAARARMEEATAEAEAAAGATRSRGETANLLNWQPPSSAADESAKL